MIQFTLFWMKFKTYVCDLKKTESMCTCNILENKQMKSAWAIGGHKIPLRLTGQYTVVGVWPWGNRHEIHVASFPWTQKASAWVTNSTKQLF